MICLLVCFFCGDNTKEIALSFGLSSSSDFPIENKHVSALGITIRLRATHAGSIYALVKKLDDGSIAPSQNEIKANSMHIKLTALEENKNKFNDYLLPNAKLQVIDSVGAYKVYSFLETDEDSSDINVVSFSITQSMINRLNISDFKIVNLAKLALVIGYAFDDNADMVGTSIVLPVTGDKGANIRWESSNTSIVTESGEVHRPAFGESNAMVTLTAFLTKSLVTELKIFNLTVLAGVLGDNNGLTGSITVNLPKVHRTDNYRFNVDESSGQTTLPEVSGGTVDYSNLEGGSPVNDGSYISIYIYPINRGAVRDSDFAFPANRNEYRIPFGVESFTMPEINVLILSDSLYENPEEFYYVYALDEDETIFLLGEPLSNLYPKDSEVRHSLQ